MGNNADQEQHSKSTVANAVEPHRIQGNRWSASRHAQGRSSSIAPISWSKGTSSFSDEQNYRTGKEQARGANSDQCGSARTMTSQAATRPATACAHPVPVARGEYSIPVVTRRSASFAPANRQTDASALTRAPISGSEIMLGLRTAVFTMTSLSDRRRSAAPAHPKHEHPARWERHVWCRIRLAAKGPHMRLVQVQW